MKTISIFGVVVIASVGLLQSAEGRPHGGGGHSFSSGSHYSSGGHYSRSAGNYSRGVSRNYYSPGGARYSSRGAYRTYSRAGVTPRSNSAVAYRNRNISGQRTVANRNTALRPQAFNAANSRIIAQHSAAAHPNWDRGHDHYWHGHRCHWYNNSWVIFDLGFYPWAYYGYGYPYGPYSYYDNGYYDDQYAQNEYSQYDNGNGDSTVSQVQAALARQGFYRGAIDGSVGPATRNALRRFQRSHGLDATGEINRSVLEALRLG